MKIFARYPPSAKGSRSNKKRRRFLNWKLLLLLIPLGVAFGVMFFYGVWAQTFDMKKVGEMPERNTVFDVDGKIYSRLAGANRLKVSSTKFRRSLSMRCSRAKTRAFSNMAASIGAECCARSVATS